MVQDTHQFGFNMWSVIDKDDKETVIGAFGPDTPVEELIKTTKLGYVLIEMTLENSPAFMNGKYINGKFYPKEGMITQ